MTRHHTPLRPARTRLRGLVVAAAIGVTGFLTVPDSAGAAPRTKSTAIAGVAAEAAEALEQWQQSQNPIDYVRFVQERDRAAAMTEVETELTPGVLQAAWSDAPLVKQQVVLNAVSQLGVPYRSLASEPGVAFDCSGLLIWAFGEAGVGIPRVSRDQIRATVSVESDDADAGDLAYYPGHISMYVGAGMMLHSPNTGSHVEITDLPERSMRYGDAVAGAAEG